MVSNYQYSCKYNSVSGFREEIVPCKFVDLRGSFSICYFTIAYFLIKRSPTARSGKIGKDQCLDRGFYTWEGDLQKISNSQCLDLSVAHWKHAALE